MSRGAGRRPVVLAVDLGSTSVKAGLYGDDARLIPGALFHAPTGLAVGVDGAAELGITAMQRATEGVVDLAVAAAARRGRPIAAVALDTLASTVCGLDARGRPATPLLTWADRRAAEDVRALSARLDADAVHERTGCPLHTSYLPAQLRWLRRTRPEAFDRVRLWADVGSVLYRRWFDAPAAASYSVAAWTGLLDRQHLRWDARLLRLLQVDEAALPRLVRHGEALRGLRPAYARRWPALARAPFFRAVGDGAAANVGSGCVSPARLALTVGTSGAMRTVVEGSPRELPPGLWCYRLSPSLSLLGGALGEGGNVFAWARSVLRLPAPAALERALAALPPDAHGLTVLPLLNGERSPGWSPAARGAIDGLSAATTSLQIAQACLEAVCYRFALLERLLRPSLTRDYEIVASGGAISGSRYWQQAMADVLGRAVRVARAPELTSRGAALLAWRSLGSLAALDEIPLETPTVLQPDPRRHEAYARGVERQRGLYGALIA